MSFRTNKLAFVPLDDDGTAETPIAEDAITEQDLIFEKDQDTLDSPLRVYRASFAGRTVAVKEMSYEDQASLKQFKYEKYIQKKLNDLQVPNIATYYGYQVTDETFSIVMEYGARTLGDWLDCSLADPGDINALTQASAIPVLRDVTRAVAGMHEQRIVHYDIKDSNILLTENNIAKLIDFGFATELDASWSPSGMGTNGWAPPEVYTAAYPCTEKVDVYSLSMVYWQCMEISLPRSDNISVLARIRVDQPEQFVKTPPGMAKLIGRGWLRDPAQRPTATEMLSELEAHAVKSVVVPKN
jgi:serine/threonine protein kinase